MIAAVGPANRGELTREELRLMLTGACSARLSLNNLQAARVAPAAPSASEVGGAWVVASPSLHHTGATGASLDRSRRGTAPTSTDRRELLPRRLRRGAELLQKSSPPRLAHESGLKRAPSLNALTGFDLLAAPAALSISRGSNENLVSMAL